MVKHFMILLMLCVTIIARANALPAVYFLQIDEFEIPSLNGYVPSPIVNIHLTIKKNNTVLTGAFAYNYETRYKVNNGEWSPWEPYQQKITDFQLVPGSVVTQWGDAYGPLIQDEVTVYVQVKDVDGIMSDIRSQKLYVNPDIIIFPRGNAVYDFTCDMRYRKNPRNVKFKGLFLPVFGSGRACVNPQKDMIKIMGNKLYLPGSGEYYIRTNIGDYKMLVLDAMQGEDMIYEIFDFYCANSVHAVYNNIDSPGFCGARVQNATEVLFRSAEPLKNTCGELSENLEVVLKSRRNIYSRTMPLFAYWIGGHGVIEVEVPNENRFIMLDPDYGVTVIAPNGKTANLLELRDLLWDAHGEMIPFKKTQCTVRQKVKKYALSDRWQGKKQKYRFKPYIMFTNKLIFDVHEEFVAYNYYTYAIKYGNEYYVVDTMKESKAYIEFAKREYEGFSRDYFFKKYYKEYFSD